MTGSEIPRHATFSLAGKKLDPQHEGGEIVLGLEGIAHRFPLEINAEAKGFKNTTIVVKDDADLATVHSISMDRSNGTILFMGAASDYTHASISMKALLPDEKGLDQVTLMGNEYGAYIRPGRTNAVPVATGVYAVSLQGDNGRSVRPRFLPKEYVVKADNEVTVQLPPTFVGRYKGTVSDGTDQSKKFELQIVIESGLSNGELTEHRGSSTRSGTWTDGRIGGDGLYRAQVHFDDAETAKAGDVVVVLQRLPDKKKIALGSQTSDSAVTDTDKKLPAYPASGELEKLEGNQQP